MSAPASDPLNPKDIQNVVAVLLRDLVHEQAGVYFGDDRLSTMVEKLEPRARANLCPTYLDYYYLLKYDERGREEWRRVMDAFSVQETYFWREYDQVEALVKTIVPAWFNRSALPLRIWSAACATGEEPYTLALALEEAGWGNHPIEILASDASESALLKARAAVYRERSFRSLPDPIREKYFTQQPDGWALSRAIVDRVTVRWANLMRLQEIPEAAHVHVIFCRNVFIYFSSNSIQQAITGFAERLPVGGHLFVGSSESLLKLTSRFELEEMNSAFVYVRKS